MSDADKNRFLRLVANAHGIDYRPKRRPTESVREVLRQIPESKCRSYLLELRRRQKDGLPLIRAKPLPPIR